MSDFLFLCGFPSSGTELLKLMLRMHPEIWLGDEFPFLPDVIRSFGNPIPAQDVSAAKARLRDLDIYGHLQGSADEASPDCDQPFEKVYAEVLLDSQPRYIGNKTPQYTERLSTIAQGFPNGRVIMIIRDVRDVCASWASKWGKSPVLCAHKWNQRMSLGAEVLRAKFGERGLLVRYEDLLSEPRAECRRIGRFLSLDGIEVMLDYADVEWADIDGKRNYGAPLDPSNIGKWQTRLAPTTAQRVEEIAFDGLQQFGYQVKLATGKRPITGRERTLGRLRDGLALFAVGNRASRNRLSYRAEALRLEWTKLRIRLLSK